jgi:hypothetical protein
MMPDDFDEEEEMMVPSFQTGGLVRETGIALVHEGEYIMPAEGSEAVIEPAAMASSATVNYYFPVEIVIAGSLPEEERAAIETRIWENLSDALERMS